MVEAVVQMGDDQDDDSLAPPHHVLPTMANPVSLIGLVLIRLGASGTEDRSRSIYCFSDEKFMVTSLGTVIEDL